MHWWPSNFLGIATRSFQHYGFYNATFVWLVELAMPNGNFQRHIHQLQFLTCRSLQLIPTLTSKGMSNQAKICWGPWCPEIFISVYKHKQAFGNRHHTPLFVTEILPCKVPSLNLHCAAMAPMHLNYALKRNYSWKLIMFLILHSHLFYLALGRAALTHCTSAYDYT